MSKQVCGYPPELVAFGCDADAIDVGRTSEGELVSALSSGTRSETPPRLFEPISVTHVVPHDSVENLAESAQTEGWREYVGGPLRVFVGQRLRLSRRQALITGVVAVVFISLLISLLGPPGPTRDATANAGNDSTKSSVAASTATPSTVAEASPTDPVTASVDLVMAGAVTELGSMQAVPRSAVTATVTSRAGDIVLVDIRVAKTSGLTAFATVLLQKVGSQWRMRQVVDERN